VEVAQGWAITFLSGPVTDNRLGYWAGGSKLNMKLWNNECSNNLFRNN